MDVTSTGMGHPEPSAPRSIRERFVVVRDTVSPFGSDHHLVIP
jgi:hypothetical protein